MKKDKISILNNDNTRRWEREEKTYFQGTIDRISRILSKHNIRVIFISQNKISQLLPNPKDLKLRLDNPGMYKIPCSCGKVYIEETGRNIRINEYTDQRIPTVCQERPLLSSDEHWMETGHYVQYDQASILASLRGYFARKYREGLKILKSPYDLNRKIIRWTQFGSPGFFNRTLIKDNPIDWNRFPSLRNRKEVYKDYSKEAPYRNFLILMMRTAMFAKHQHNVVNLCTWHPSGNHLWQCQQPRKPQKLKFFNLIGGILPENKVWSAGSFNRLFDNSR